jgi:CarD family transcriptional regulator
MPPPNPVRRMAADKKTAKPAATALKQDAARGSKKSAAQTGQARAPATRAASVAARGKAPGSGPKPSAPPAPAGKKAPAASAAAKKAPPAKAAAEKAPAAKAAPRKGGPAQPAAGRAAAQQAPARKPAAQEAPPAPPASKKAAPAKAAAKKVEAKKAELPKPVAKKPEVKKPEPKKPEPKKPEPKRPEPKKPEPKKPEPKKPEAKKPEAKKERTPPPPPSPFAVGDKVVYPHHGAAVIVRKERVAFQGQRTDYFVLEVATDQLILKVPVHTALDRGVRPVISRVVARKVLATFREPPEEAGANWSRWYKLLTEKINSGDIFQVAEVVRDLTFAQQTKGISPALKRMLSKARLILASELRFALDVSEEEAMRRLDKALPRVEAAEEL